MTKKKLLNFFKKVFLMEGPGLVLGLLILIGQSQAFSMCNFPHNPAVLCTQVSIGKISVEKERCQVELKVAKAYRPKNVYGYDDSLKLISYTKNDLFPTKAEQTLYADKKYCQKLKVSKEVISLAVKLNCYDEDPTIADYAWKPIALSAEVRDPWSKKMVRVDCSFLGKK